MIPLAKPNIPPEAHEYLKEVLDSGRLVKGPQARAFEEEILAQVPVANAIACSSGTVALWALLRGLGLPSGGRVAVPAFTFAGVAHSVVHAGGIPVPVDIELDSLGMDPAELERTTQSDTLWGAIVVDPFGIPLRFSPFERIAEERGLTLIEDAACALQSTCPNNQPAGTRGSGAILSFHPRKPVTTGEGGMILTRDDALATRIRALLDHGYDPASGTYRSSGFNGRLSELGAALGRSSLSALTSEIEARSNAIATYQSVFKTHGLQDHIRLVVPQEKTRWNGQTLVGLFQSPAVKLDAFRDAMRSMGVEVGRTAQWWPGLPHFTAHDDNTCPVAKYAEHQTIALPLYRGLSNDDILHIVSSIQRALEA